MPWIHFSGTWWDFCKQDLNVVGTRVEVAIEQRSFGTHPNYTTPPPELQQFLIGDINKNAGVCDDCVAFSTDSNVIRYSPPTPSDET